MATQTPSWPALFLTSCRHHLGDVGVLLCTVAFALVAAWVGLLMIRSG